MALTNSSRSYGSLARFLHWAVALLVIANLALGLYAEDLPRDTQAEVTRLYALYSIHKTIGVAALALAVLRILWALVQPRPAPLYPERRIETFAATAVHWSLYIATIAVPATGWLSHAASQGFAPILWPFGQTLPLVTPSPALEAVLARLHGAAGNLLLLSVGLHLAGTLRHVLIDRDDTLGRMILGRAPRVGYRAAPHGAGLTAIAAWIALFLGALMLAPRQPPADAVPAPDTAAAVPASTAPQAWTVRDGALGFSVRQAQAEVKGSFGGWTADIAYDPATRSGNVTVRVDMATLAVGAVTAQASGPAFLDVAGFPQATFLARIEPRGEVLAAVGTLSLHGAEVPVELPFTLTLAGDAATAAGALTLDRRDFGIGKDFPDETTVGFDVRVAFELNATLAPSAANNATP